MIYPLAYIAFSSALTVLLIAAGLAGEATLAAEIAVVQGALLATFYAFSANARSLILQGHDSLTASALLAKRVLALPALAGAAYLLCVHMAGVSTPLVLVLIGRRCCEWFAEVRLCEMEVAGQRRAALWALGVQTVVTLTAASVLSVPALRLPALIVFAVSPLLSAAPRFQAEAFRPAELLATLRGASPYIGSTAIEGVATYVLRLVVFLIAGPVMAGMLFTAFALGSFVATLFANIVGPSIAMQRARGERPPLRTAVWMTALLMAGWGVALPLASLAMGQPAWLGKPGHFWLALGFSFLGAAVMVAAQHIRLRLFDERQAEVLFGPDVLRNLAAILAAPALYYVVAPEALSALYLATALLTFFFYWGAHHHATRELAAPRWAALRIGLAAALLLPLFFLLNGRIYHSPGAPLLDAGGGLTSVPLPLSLAACFAGLLLIARYRHATLALGTIFFLFVAMVLTTIVVTHGEVGYESRKFLLLFQFLVPAFGLALGQMFGAPRQGLALAAAGFLCVLVPLVPVQALHSIGYGENELRHDLWVFSIYQHLQYVPAVLACAYLVSLFAFWESRRGVRLLLVALAAPVAWYMAASHASLAVVVSLSGALLLLAARPRERAAWLCAALIVVTSAAFIYANRDSAPMRQKFERSADMTDARLAQGPAAGVSRTVVEAVPGPMQVRLHYWKLFGAGIAESKHTVLFGHAEAIDRSVAASAHNYYLDFVYNFGVLSFLPFVWLILWTLWRLWRLRAKVWRELPLLGLSAAVLYALFLDSMFKVPLRQPYPGIFFFFLWGLLLANLRPARGAAR